MLVKAYTCDRVGPRVFEETATYSNAVLPAVILNGGELATFHLPACINYFLVAATVVKADQRLLMEGIVSLGLWSQRERVHQGKKWQATDTVTGSNRITIFTHRDEVKNEDRVKQ